MNKYKKLGKDFILLFIGNFSSKILVFLMVPFYTSCLSTEQYGVADLITTTVTLLCPILTLTINEAVMRFSLDKEIEKEKVFSIGLYISGFSIILMIAIIPIIYLSQSLRNYTMLVLAYYIANVLNVLLSQFTKGIDKVKTYTISGIIQTVLNVCLNILFLLVFRWGIEGYLWANIIGLLAGMLFSCVNIKANQYVVSIKKSDWKLIRDMLVYSLPLIPNNLAWWVTNSSDKYMVSFFLGTASLGVYSVAYKIPSIMTTITSLFSMAMRISSVDGFGSKESEKFINNTYKVYTAFLAIVTSLIIGGSEFIGRILFQKEFFIAWKISPILLIGFMFFSLAEYLGVIYLAAKQTEQILITCLIGAGINILLNILLIPLFGNNGAAIATSASYFVIWLFRIIGCQRYVKIHINLTEYLINCILLIFTMMVTLNKNALGICIGCIVTIALNFKPLISIVKTRLNKRRTE